MSITMPQMRLWSRYENVCPNLTPEQALSLIHISEPTRRS